jgi:hypothetical protein
VVLANGVLGKWTIREDIAVYLARLSAGADGLTCSCGVCGRLILQEVFEILQFKFGHFFIHPIS